MLTITAAAAFKVLIPAACAAFAAAALFPRLRRTAGALAWKLTLFGIAIMLVIPTGIRVSDLIEDTYQASIAATIQEAKDATDTIQNSQSENAETEQTLLRPRLKRLKHGGTVRKEPGRLWMKKRKE